MIARLKYILTLFLGLIFINATAQNSQVLYFMNLPQNHLLNPALRPSNSLYIGLPALTGINLNVNNNFMNFSDVFMKGQPKDSIISILNPKYNVDDFLSKIKSKNSIEPEFTIQLLGIGFSVGQKNYVFLDINDRFDGNVVIPGDLFKLALKGNAAFAGSKIDMSSLRADVKYYREIGIGFSRDITNKLRLGVKGKLLYGIATASIDNRSLGITVNNDYSHTINADLTANFSAPLTVTMNAENIQSFDFDDKRFDTGSGITNFITGKKNTGLGLDIGATYDIFENLVVSAAVTDLGFIRWKKDVTNLKTDNQFLFSGLNIVDVVNGTKTFDEVGQDMLDSLKNSFKVTKTNSPFTTYLPVGVSLGGSYSLTKSISVGLLSYSRFIGKQLRESLTMSANLNLGNAFSTSLTYTAANHRFDNIGAGLAFRAGILQFYFITDRIPLAWNKIKYETKELKVPGREIVTPHNLTLPASWNTVNMRLGMNLAFGNKIKKKNDKPMITVD